MKKVFKKRLELITFIFINLLILLVFSCITYKYGFSLIMLMLSMFFIILNYINYKHKDKFDYEINSFIKYRYIIYLIIFIICVVFKVSGSSIGIYDEVITEKNDYSVKSTLFGNYRSVRSDEFLVLTPYYFSQVDNHFKKYSNNMSLDGQNMIIGYNAPVLDITTLAKPLNWGYILFGKDYGLSWYWCMKLILIFAFSLECMLILTRKNNVLSILGAFMITFGPSTQWWFCPHMPDVILWSMALFSSLYYFFTSKNEKIRNVLTIIVPLMLTEFVIALFPSFQVGLGYFIFLLFLCLIYRDKIKLFKDKKQNIRSLIVLVISFSLIGYFIYTNINDLRLTSNTVYPGHRVELGGQFSLRDLFTDLTTIFLSYKPNIPYSNLCEISTYIHFGVFFLLLSPIIIYNLKKDKDRDWIVGLIFDIILLVYMIFMIFGFPEFLAKITLFSYINRMKMIFGLISVFYSIWSLNAFEKLKCKINKKHFILCILIYMLFYIFTINNQMLLYLSKYLYFLEILAYGIILLFICFDFRKMAYSCIFSIILFASITINPITIGTSPIYNHPSATKIKEIIKKDSNSYWLGEGNLYYPSYLLANGAKVINAVNYYPDLKKWKIIDPDEKYKDIYNRYAHIVVELNSDNKNSLELVTPDCIKAKLTVESIYRLGVKYILSEKKLELEENKYDLKQIYNDKDVYIYMIDRKGVTK